MKKILLLSSLLTLSGCSAFTGAPTTKFRANLDGHEVSWQNPKNTTVSNFTLTVSSNSATMSFGAIISTNDAQVIDKTLAGQAALFKVVADSANQMATDIVAAGVKAAK